MKLIKEGKIPACRIWRGTCSHCKSEWEALESELSSKIKSCPREKYDFANTKCDFCSNESLIMYPTEDYSNDTLKLSNEELMQHILCSKCNKGTMIKEVDKVYLTSPVQYKYVCNACGHIDYKFN